MPKRQLEIIKDEDEEEKESVIPLTEMDEEDVNISN